MPKTLTGVKRAEFCQMVIKSTATMFAIMVNPENQGPKFKFTPKRLAELSFSSGFFATGYSKNDQINEYSYPSQISLEEFWLKYSEQFAEQLLNHSGLLETE